MKQFLIILLLFTILLGLQAEPYVTRSYAYRYFSTRDGLAQMQVMCAFQDSDGYLWFGTKGGVSRWDGLSFKNYTSEEGIPTGEIVSIDECGLLKIIFTHRHMTLLFPNDSTVVQPLPKGILFSARECKTIILNKNNILLLGLHSESDNWKKPTSKNFIYNIQHKKFKPLLGFKEHILSSEKNYIYTESGIFLWKNNKFNRLIKFPFLVELATSNKAMNRFILQPLNQQVNYVYKYESGKFSRLTEKSYTYTKKSTWLPDDSYLFLYNNAHDFFPNRATTLQKSLTYPNFAFIDKENNLWIGTENGLYNYFNLNIEEYKFNLGEPDNIWSIVEDDNGNMWLGSYGNGLWTMDKSGNIERKKFSNSFQKKHKEGALKLQYMGSTIGYKNTIFMTNSFGVSKFINGKFTINSNTPGCLYAYFDKTTNQIYYSGLDTTTNQKGLYVGMNKNKAFYPFELGFPICIVRDGHGKIRVGAFRGNGWLENEQLKCDTSKHEYTGVISMALDNQKRLWKATEKGIYVELFNSKEFRVSPKALTGAFTSLVVYKNKYLIVGGTHSFAIIDIESDNYSNLKAVNIGYDAGFTGLESGQNGILIDSQGYVWLATALNVLKFKPEDIVKNHQYYIPALRIKNISYSTNNLNWKIHSFTDGNAKISSKNKFFQVEYIANSISAPKSLRFQYRLLGLSDKWSESVYKKSISYTNIGFGKYQFEVKCSMDGEHWSNIQKSPIIEITAPFYMRPWSIFAIVMLLIIISIISTRMIVKRNNQRKLEKINRQKLENELQLNTLRTKIIPHFTKNVLSAIGHFAMTDKLKAGHYISVFSKFNGLTLANADKNYNSIKNEIEYIQVYLELEKMRFGDRFNYQITVNKNIDRNTLIPTMILHTYCDNAIRHGLVNKKETGILKIEIAQSNQGILITITDNGIGRKKAKEIGTQGEGQGLRLIDNQLEFYNQKNKHKIIQTITDLQNENGKALGTKIELHIPTMYSFE